MHVSACMRMCVCMHVTWEEEVQSTNSADTMQITLPGAYNPTTKPCNGCGAMREEEIEKRNTPKKIKIKTNK